MRNLMQHVCCTEVLASNITSIVTKPSFDLESLDPFIIKETLIKRIEVRSTTTFTIILWVASVMCALVNEASARNSTSNPVACHVPLQNIESKQVLAVLMLTRHMFKVS